MQSRPTIAARNGVIAAGHPLVAAAGLRALMEGGNAVDAAVTAAFTAAVVLPHMNGVGGDAFCLYHAAASGRTYAYNGAGAAPRAIDARLFEGSIPLRGPLAMTVPGAVDAWCALLARFGTWDLPRAMAPAIRYAEEGFPVGPVLAQWFQRAAPALRRFPDSAATLLRHGVPGPLDTLRQPELGQTLRAIAAGGPAAFYRGPLAERIAASVQAQGGVLSAQDLAEHAPGWTEPLSAEYGGLTVAVQPPMSQHYMVLQQLRMLAGDNLTALGHNGADYVHLLFEVARRAFADRARHFGDIRAGNPVPALLDPGAARRRRAEIDPLRASAAVPAADLGGAATDTTYLAVADAAGNVVSLIQSLFHDFGSCFVAGDTGVVLNNRLTGFSLDPTSPNYLLPGRLPIHTLGSAIVFEDGHPAAVIGTPGANAQVQVVVQLFLNLFTFGLDPQVAVEMPRFLLTDDGRLALEGPLHAELGAALGDRGHQVVAFPQWHPQFGGAALLRIHTDRGLMLAAADPRRQGYAAGW